LNDILMIKGLWLYRLRAYTNWLKEPLHFWIAILVTIVILIVMIIAIMSGEKCESSIRIAGLCFQLAGLYTVIRGISATRRLFGLAGFFSPLRHFLRRRPPWVPTPVNASGHMTIAPFTLRAEGSSCMNARPDDPPEKRITALEKNLDMVNRRLSQLTSDNNKRFDEIRATQETEGLKYKHTYRSIRQYD
jgi:hypothetical protein